MSEFGADITGIRLPRHLMLLARNTLWLQKTMRPLLEEQARLDDIPSLGQMGNYCLELDGLSIVVKARQIFTRELTKNATAIIGSDEGLHEVRVTANDDRRQVRVFDAVGKTIDDPEVIKRDAARLRIARNAIARGLLPVPKLNSVVQNGTITPYDMATKY